MTATATRCNPIIFSEPMVQAILDGRKTQTRRTIKPQPIRMGRCVDHSDGWLWPPGSEPGEDGCRWPIGGDATRGMVACCPYGAVGDHLWVRERALYWTGGAAGTIDVKYSDDPELARFQRDQAIVDQLQARDAVAKARCGNWEWRPSIHMPRWASRITLEITGVRVQQVQDVSEPDAIAEGFERREHFARYWDVLNEKRGHGFDANPWVWVIAFDCFCRLLAIHPIVKALAENRRDT